MASEGGRTEGAKAKGEGESKARTAMGGAERLDAVRSVAAAKGGVVDVWPAPKYGIS